MTVAYAEGKQRSSLIPNWHYNAQSIEGDETGDWLGIMDEKLYP